ncbi:MAG TPA: LPS assembly protein LptD [Pseudomonadales bacterium]|nr:LPS assembly protein LptD [Pseudomonadales bacterium]
MCSPSSDGTGWQCSGAGTLPTPIEKSDQPPGPNASTPPQKVPPAKAAALTLDWVPRSELPASRLSVLPEYCDGAYVEPVFPALQKGELETLPMHAEAQQLQYWVQDRADLSGSVEVTRGNQSLIANQATYHETDRTVTVDNGVTLRQPGMLVVGDSAIFLIDTGAASVTDSQFVLQANALRGTAGVLYRSGEGDLEVSRGSFTRCEPGNNEWRLTSSTMSIPNGSKFGTATNAVLRVHDVPVFYTPYIRFPVTSERMSGWLFPDVAVGDTNGTDIAVPYYLNLAPNYDATITPRYISERGEDLEGELRFLSPYGRGFVGGAFLSKDDEYDGQYSRTDFANLGLPGPFDPANRWLFTAKQQGKYGDFATEVNTTKVSDFDYFRDLGSNLASSSQVQLQQYAAASYAHRGLSTRVWVQDFQRLDVDVVEPYRRLPEVDVNYAGQLFGPVAWNVASSWASFERPNGQFTGIQQINGDRLNIEPRVRVPFDWTPGFLHFAGGYRYTRYNLDDVPVGTSQEPDRKIWMGSVDSGLFFERESELFGGGIQTLEPRLFYLYQQYRNQNDLPEFDVSDLSFTFDQLFRDNRFAGIDRIGDANQLTAAVTTRWLNADTGAERFRASLGQIFYFEDRRVTSSGVITADDVHKSSAFAGQIGATLSNALVFYTSATWDPNDGQLNEIGSTLQYRADNRHIINLSYRRRDDIQPLLKQTDASFYWSILRQYALIGRFDYDLEEHRTIEALGGLEYSDCCLQIRIVGRKFLSTPGSTVTPDAQSDEGIFIQVVFKGLASLGGRIDSMMHSGIPGYVAEEF